MSDLVLGIDYGGTSTKLLLARSGFSSPVPLAQATVATARAHGALDTLARQVTAFLAGRAVRAGAVTVAGIIAPDGTVATATNLSWLEGLDVGAELSDRLAIPVGAVHDGRSAALAEAVLGAGRGAEDIYVIVLGTGIGSAHVVAGSVATGAHSAAGEIGHISQDDAGRPCSCGQRGCLETFIGGTQLAREWQRVSDGPATATALDLIAAGRAGDGRALGVLDAATTALAKGLLGLIATVDPGLIVLGGGLSQAPDLIIEPTLVKVRERATFHQLPTITTATLGPWAGAWGAALLADAPLRTSTAQLLA